MNIRTAQLSDLDNLVALFDAYRQFYKQPVDTEAAQNFIAARLLNQDAVILLACTDDTTIGFTLLYPSFSSVAMKPIYILNDLFVIPEARKQGVARALLQAAESVTEESGAIRLTLATEHTNVTAQALYEKSGWEKDETFFHYTRNVTS
jgi:GNAT superfamily N-acetyltransferase